MTESECTINKPDLLRGAGFWMVGYDGTYLVSHKDHWHDASTGERVWHEPAGRGDA